MLSNIFAVLVPAIVGFAVVIAITAPKKQKKPR
jgi:hypothetical protein